MDLDRLLILGCIVSMVLMVGPLAVRASGRGRGLAVMFSALAVLGAVVLVGLTRSLVALAA